MAGSHWKGLKLLRPQGRITQQSQAGAKNLESFLENHWCSVNLGNLKILVLTSAKESLSTASWVNQIAAIRRKTEGVKGK